MTLHKITIEAKPFTTVIKADGKEIPGVIRFELSQEVGQAIPVVRLELRANTIEFVGNGQIHIPKQVKHRHWTTEEQKLLRRLKEEKKTQSEIAKRLGRTEASINTMWRTIKDGT